MSPSLLVDARDLESYIPVQDPRRAAKPCVIKGTNFIFDVDGPRSAFATQFANWFKFDKTTRAKVVEFQVEDEFFYGTPTGIWRIMPVSFEPELMLDLPVSPSFKYWPWTCALVGNLYYFAQHNIGLWQYDPSSLTWTEIATPEGRNVRGICESYGRLVCLGAVTVFWSSLDDGFDLTPSVTTGAGFQALSMLSKNAFRVDGVADGILVSTDKGYLKGEFVAANYIFRWYVVSRQMRPFSPSMGAVIPDIGLLTLDTRGFYVSAGGKPEVWEPAMGEYLSKTYIARMDRRRFGCAAIHFSYAAKQIFVSFAPNEREGSFLIAFVFHIPSGKWGVFSTTHRGFFEILRKPFNIQVCGYMDYEGYMQMLTNAVDRETFPAAPNSLLDFLVRKFDEPKSRFVQSLGDIAPVMIGRTDLWLLDFGPSLLSASVPRSGLYHFVESLQGTEYFDVQVPAPPDPAWYDEIS